MDIDDIIEDIEYPERKIFRDIIYEDCLDLLSGESKVIFIADEVIKKQMAVKAIMCLLLSDFGKKSKYIKLF